MHDNWMIAFAMAVAAAGIACLLFALIIMEAPLAPAGEIAQAADGTPYRVRGEVISVQERGGITTITLLQNATMDLVVFSNISALRKGECVIAAGKKSSYQGAAQLSVSRIQRCEKRS